MQKRTISVGEGIWERVPRNGKRTRDQKERDFSFRDALKARRLTILRAYKPRTNRIVKLRAPFASGSPISPHSLSRLLSVPNIYATTFASPAGLNTLFWIHPSQNTAIIGSRSLDRQSICSHINLEMKFNI